MSDDNNFEYLTEIREIPPISTPILNVSIDALALLDHLEGNEQRTFEFLGKLKDLFAS